MTKLIDKKIRLMFLAALFSIALIIHAFSHFSSSFLEMELQRKQQELVTVSETSTEQVQRKYVTLVSALEFGSTLFSNYPDMNEESIQQILYRIRELTIFRNVGAADPKGNMIDLEYGGINISHRKYFTEALSGRTAISEVIIVQTADDLQAIAVPIKNDAGITGVLVGFMDVDAVEREINDELASNIYIQIVDSTGEYVTRAVDKDSLIKSSNVWDDFHAVEFVKGSLAQVQDDVAHQKSGSITFKINDEERISYYAPLGINNYYIYSTMNSTSLKERTSAVSQKVLKMALEMAGAVLILIAALYWYSKKAREEILESHKAMASSEEIMRIALKESRQVVFEYNVVSQELHTKAGTLTPLFHLETLTQVPESILALNVIDEEFIPEFLQLFERLKTSETSEALIRLHKNGSATWLKIIMKNLYDSRQKIVNTVGIIENVTEKKQEELHLQERAERDGLTGLYNAATMKLNINALLKSPWSSEYSHVFALIDLDNFKTINDTFGHQYGDQVLKDVSAILTKKFRSNDIIGRLGGDEFVLMALNVPNFSAMEHVFGELVEELNIAYKKDGATVSVSASLGITIAPQHGSSFDELYQKSDEMLYEVKRNNKNGYRVYGS